MSLLTPFNPDPAVHGSLLDDLMDSSLPLRDLADRYQTSLSALCFWMARPEIATELSILHASAYNRARLTATTHLDSALQAMALIVRKFLEEQANLDPDLTPEQQRRAEETGRRAATILLRFIKNRPASLSSPASAGQMSQAQRVTERVPSSTPTTTDAQAPSPAPSQHPSSTPISTTALAQAALQALAEMRPDLIAAPPNPSPPPTTNNLPPPAAPNPQSEIPNPQSQQPIHDYLQSHLPSEVPTSSLSLSTPQHPP